MRAPAEAMLPWLGISLPGPACWQRGGQVLEEFRHHLNPISENWGGWKTHPRASGMETHPRSLPYQTPFLRWHPVTICTSLQPGVICSSLFIPALTPSKPQFLK